MNKKEIVYMIGERIQTCYKELLFARNQKGYRKDWIEGFRSRLDELLLVYHKIYNISFIDACERLGIRYEDMDAQDNEEELLHFKETGIVLPKKRTDEITEEVREMRKNAETNKEVKGCEKELGYRHESGVKAYCGEEAFGGNETGLINIFCSKCEKKYAKESKEVKKE